MWEDRVDFAAVFAMLIWSQKSLKLALSYCVHPRISVRSAPRKVDK